MIGQTIGHYRIDGKLGEGGMGVVYRAVDTKLGREVALKLLPAGKVSDLDRRNRFLREARAAALLNHPNIITVHDVGEAEGALFIVMEYVAGSTLADSIPPSGLDPERARRYANQICAALAKAHGAGIVHRDLKPANIMITRDGDVKVLDFGLAKLTEPLSETDATRTAIETQAGFVLGTAAYMSPEQAQGMAVDPRSDIFSFGAVLYEMLSGQRAFFGGTPVATMAAILSQPPRPLRAFAPQVPEGLERVVARCLDKDPARRFQNMAEILRELNSSPRSDSPSQPARSVAVLPFANLAADKDNEYFSDGLSEEIINALTKLPGLKVTARTSAFAFKGKHEDIRRIGEALGVAHVLEGSVRKAGSRVRITAQLIGVSDGCHLWSGRYDRELTDIFAIQDEVSAAIVGVLDVKLGGEAARSAMPRPTGNMEAYQAYLEGLHHINQFTAASLERARERFERAVHLDPGYSQPHAGIAQVHYYRTALFGVRPREAMPQGLEAAERAVALDPASAEGLSARGVMRALYKYEWTAAGDDLRRAVELNPASAIAHYRLASWFYRPLRRWPEMLASAERAVELDPLSPLVRFAQGYFFSLSGQKDAAIEMIRSAVKAFPDNPAGCWFSSLVLVRQGRLDEAQMVVGRGLQADPGNANLQGLLAEIHAKAGRRDEALRILDQLEDRSRRSFIAPSTMVGIYLAIGDLDKVYERMEQCVEECDPYSFSPVGDPLGIESLDPNCRSDARFVALLRRMNLA